MAKLDIHQQVTDTIVSLLESGTNPWVKPWTGSTGGMPRNASTGKKYNGVNIPILWAAAQRSGFSGNEWLTYNQAAAMGGNVVKGQKGTNIVLYKTLEIEDKESATIKRIPMLRSFTVFNTDQVEGLPIPEIVEKAPFTVEEKTEQAIKLFSCYSERCGVSLSHGGDSAFYQPATDNITMPERTSFNSDHGYAATLLHEAIHSTGHKSRLDRFKDKTGQGYAFEELVAELGSAFICADLGIENQIENHASYIAAWLSKLKSDKTFIFKAAAMASKAQALIVKPDNS